MDKPNNPRNPHNDNRKPAPEPERAIRVGPPKDGKQLVAMVLTLRDDEEITLTLSGAERINKLLYSFSHILKHYTSAVELATHDYIEALALGRGALAEDISQKGGLALQIRDDLRELYGDIVTELLLAHNYAADDIASFIRTLHDGDYTAAVVPFKIKKSDDDSGSGSDDDDGS